MLYYNLPELRPVKCHYCVRSYTQKDDLPFLLTQRIWWLNLVKPHLCALTLCSTLHSYTISKQFNIPLVCLTSMYTVILRY